MIIKILLWLLFSVLTLVILTTVTAFICFMKVFYIPPRKEPNPDEYPMPPGEIYEPYREMMTEWVKSIRSMQREFMEITSHDGLKLTGVYYECKKGAPLEILFHGYKGNAERDLSGAVERCFAIGRNALIVNQRASADSEGNVVTFGILERKDCLSWIDFAIEHFGTDTKIILTGVSMGAATVMMAAGEELPKNVVCVLADCGYTSAKEIIKKVIRDMRLPDTLLYPFVKLGARLFGGFDLEETSPLEAMKKSKVPIIFIHGDTDDFVPFYMSEELYGACTSEHKRLVAVEGAGHGVAYPKNKELYLDSLRDFENKCGFLK